MAASMFRPAASFLSKFQFSLRSTNRLIVPGQTVVVVPALVQQQQIREKHNRKLNIKWRRERRAKVFKMNLPNTDDQRKQRNMSMEEQRSEMKKKGILPPRTFQERPINISCSNEINKPYAPPEGDGRQSLISVPGVKQRYTQVEKKGKSILAIRKIKQYDDDFNSRDFAEFAQESFRKVHELLQDYKNNEFELHDLVTEKAYPEMTEKLDLKTMRWKFIDTVEPPRVVQANTQDVMSKENLFAQVTVRLHTRQTLAIYDRFGRLMFGSESAVRDVLEYVVFEKHLSDEYGVWRIHGKIIPEWMPPRDNVRNTFRKPQLPEILPDDDEEAAVKEADVVVKDVPDSGTTPALAGA
ncbi:large ribosomal subunit protein mL45-like [Tubulanus polymorphus]|uniref:large ribosomal subunit protein mL45-like n=1 Tax=Tubulanus polymorphus TaxID=672921 RepID=UPI003DA64188